MQLNPKLLQYSLDIKPTQSKVIKQNHDHHLRRLKQIQHQSKPLAVKQKTQSLKQITDSVHKYHQLSRNFKYKQIQQKKCSQDLKMIRSLSQIHQNRYKQQKMHQQINKSHQQYKQRNENHRKLITLLKSKQLQQRNLKIAIRISRQQNDFSYVDKIKNQIKEYSKIRKNLQKIKDEPIIWSRIKKNDKKKKNSKLLTEGCESHISQTQDQIQKINSMGNVIIQKAEQDSQQQFLYEVLRKNPSQILNERFFNQNSNQNKNIIMLPKLS